MLLDIFNDDAFSVVELTDAIELLPFEPQRLSGLFEDKPIRTTSAMLDIKDGVIDLVPTRQRGAPGIQRSRRSRSARQLAVPHLPIEDSIKAEDIQNVRSFGSEDDLETAGEVLAESMEDMKTSLEVTQEFHRAGAIQGRVLDADGTELYNLFNEFGVAEVIQNWNFGADSPKQLIVALKRLMRDQLGAAVWRNIHVFCGEQFFDNLIADPEIRDAFDRWNDGEFKRTDQSQEGTQGFPYCGVFWEEFRYKVGAQDFLQADQARAVPMGVPGMFKRYLAPADYMETANTLGRSMYAKQERAKYNKGIDLEAQVNPLFVCRRPSGLILLQS